MSRVSFVCADGSHQQSQVLPQSSWLSLPPRAGPSCILLSSFHSTLYSPERRCSLFCSCSCEGRPALFKFLVESWLVFSVHIQSSVMWIPRNLRDATLSTSTPVMKRDGCSIHLDLLKSITTSFSLVVFKTRLLSKQHSDRCWTSCLRFVSLLSPISPTTVVSAANNYSVSWHLAAMETSSFIDLFKQWWTGGRRSAGTLDWTDVFGFTYR